MLITILVLRYLGEPSENSVDAGPLSVFNHGDRYQFRGVVQVIARFGKRELVKPRTDRQI